MDPLFSHAPQPEPAKPPGPSREDVFTLHVPAPQDVAYSALTGDLHLWWPVEHTVFGFGTHPAMEDDVLGEEAEDGRVALWARIVEEEAPRLLVLDWHLGGDPARGARVVVELEPDAEGTAITLRAKASAASQEEPGAVAFDWAAVLGRFAAFFGQPADSVVRG